jgi:hypothetical protein
MLESQATRLGSIGEDTYYVLDGKAWRITGGVVYRSDDDRESHVLKRLAREFGA